MAELKIIPFGKVPIEVLDAIAEELQSAYGIFAIIDNPLGLPKEFFNPVRHQFQSDKVLDFISNRFRERTLAVTDSDIYTEKLSFIFGHAQVGGTASLISIHRLDPMLYKKQDKEGILIERSVKEAVHEIGHVLGLEHCDNTDCVMSFSNTVFDVDKKSKGLCERCKNKIKI